MSKGEEYLKQLFQREFSKMVAVISKIYGLRHIEIAEDVVSETFLKASETWIEGGLPPNPVAWLYKVAKQKTMYHFRRNKIFDKKIVPALKALQDVVTENDGLFDEENIKDSQLKMMFAVCDPAVVSESQIALALRILCGFGIDEIAEAFLSNKETINKRLFRAKEKLRTANVQLALPSPAEMRVRLDNVLHILYLLFNEGYYSKTQNKILRKELCFEALRLTLILTQYDVTNLPKTNALIALMCYHASRFEARQDESNYFIVYEKQDESLWNKELISKGNYYFEQSANGDTMSTYHLEACIAYWHCQKEDSKEKWYAILECYNSLLQLNYSPIIALNRNYALYKAKGKEIALYETEKLQLTTNHFYFVLLGELYTGKDNTWAKQHFQSAYILAKTETEKQYIQQKLCRLTEQEK